MAQEHAERGKRPVRCYDDVANMIRDIAAYHEINMEDALEKYGGPGIRREYKRVIEAKHAVLGEAGA